MKAYFVPPWTGPCARVLGLPKEMHGKSLPLSSRSPVGERCVRGSVLSVRGEVCAKRLGAQGKGTGNCFQTTFGIQPPCKCKLGTALTELAAPGRRHLALSTEWTHSSTAPPPAFFLAQGGVEVYAFLWEVKERGDCMGSELNTALIWIRPSFPCKMIFFWPLSVSVSLSL